MNTQTLKEYVVTIYRDGSLGFDLSKDYLEKYKDNPDYTLLATFNKDEPYQESAGVEEMFRKRFGDTPDMSDVAHWCVYEQGFIDGGAASPAGDGWVSVQVDLPKTDDEVLVYFDCDEMIVQAYFNHRNNIWYGSANVRSQMREGDCEDAELRHEKVTHWRPLPTPPNKSV